MRQQPHRPGLCVCLAILSGVAFAPTAEAEYATTDDGVRVYYDTMGAGVPIVIIAGGPGGSGNGLRYTHTLLQSCGRLVFLHNRGRGRSENVSDRPNAYTLENDLRDVEAVRRALGAERIIVYGHSYGSMVAMAYASRYSQHTLALITTAGVHGARVWQDRNIDGVKQFLRHHYPKRWLQIAELHDAGHLTSEPRLAAMFDELDALYLFDIESRERVIGQFTEYRDPKTVGFNRNVYHMMIGSDPEWTLDGTLRDVELLSELGNFTGPSLILGGRHDRICPPVNQVEIATALPNARLVFFEQSGHAPFFEEPLRFLRVVSDFLHEVVEQEPD